MGDNKILISEIFGPTIQGEGSLIGSPTVFVRTGGCSYLCAWCDTLYAVLQKYKKDWTPMTAEEIFSSIQRLSPKPILVTLSGGNPAMQNLSALVELGHEQGYAFSIETQGDIPAFWLRNIDFPTFSPKPPSSLMRTDLKKLDECIALCEDNNNTSLKIVVSDKRDYEYAKSIFARYREISKKYITPCNISPGDADLEALCEKTKFIADMVIQDGLNDVCVVPQLHVFLWGNKRGV